MRQVKVGDLILITKSKLVWNIQGAVDKYVGKVYRVTRTNGDYAMFKDDGGWYWSRRYGDFKIISFDVYYNAI